jgi:hypothetical protein
MKTASIILIALIAASLCFVSFDVCGAQGTGNIGGIISSDATWTKADSPYTLVGPVAIVDATLTIEPGVTINLGNYYIQVNGTLIARGTSTDNIVITNGNHYDCAVLFMNPGACASSVFENVVVDTSDFGVSIRGDLHMSQVTINSYYALEIYEGTPVISNNILNGQVGFHSHDASAILTNNLIVGGISATSSSPALTVTGNTIRGKGVNIGVTCSEGAFTSNIITGFETGILPFGGATIERNLIIGNQEGIRLDNLGGDYYYTPSPARIQHNTIVNNTVGVTAGGTSQTIQANVAYNNLYNNQNYNFYLGTSTAFSAPNNWWGSTEIEQISQTIYDWNKNFNYGTLTYQPYLSVPDPEAPSPDIYTSSEPTATPNPDQAQTPTEITPTPTLYSAPSDVTPDIAQVVFVVLLTVALVAIIGVLAVRPQMKRNQKTATA